MKRLLYIAACALVVCSCSEDQLTSEFAADDTVADSVVADDNSMRFSAEYPATRATETEFEQNDVMGVFAAKYSDEGETVELQVSGNHGNNAPYTLDGTTWSSSLPIYWEEGMFDIYAYYPYMEVVSITDNPFSVATDQSTAATDDALSGYEASDFLWTKSEGIEQAEITNLTFAHRLSKVAIHLVKGDDYEGELPYTGEVFIHNTVAEATINLTSGFVTKNPYASTATIKARQVSNVLYEVVVIPQRIDSNIPVFELVMEGVSYLVESKFVFTMATQHNVYLTVSSDPNKVKIEIGGEVSGDWN